MSPRRCHSTSHYNIAVTGAFEIFNSFKRSDLQATLWLGCQPCFHLFFFISLVNLKWESIFEKPLLVSSEQESMWEHFYSRKIKIDIVLRSGKITKIVWGGVSVQVPHVREKASRATRRRTAVEWEGCWNRIANRRLIFASYLSTDADKTGISNCILFSTFLHQSYPSSQDI